MLVEMIPAEQVFIIHFVRLPIGWFRIHHGTATRWVNGLCNRFARIPTHGVSRHRSGATTNVIFT